MSDGDGLSEGDDVSDGDALLLSVGLSLGAEGESLWLGDVDGRSDKAARQIWLASLTAPVAEVKASVSDC